MQQYFKTGKTIVIDDQHSEAQPLLDALSRNQIPFLYTQGKPNSEFPLPNSNPEDAQYYSLIFLDLNLDFKFAGGKIGSEGEEKTFKGTHVELLNTIVKNKNRSFIIVIWSNEEENYKDEFLKIFQDGERYFTPKKPYKIISLSKPDFFTPNGAGGYQFIAGKEEELKERISAQLTDLDAFKLFCEWDRVVSLSVGDTVDDFMSLLNDIEGEEEREKHLAEVLTSISIAYAGEDGFLKSNSDEEKTDAVLLALTQILNDDIDRNVLNERQSEFKNWQANNQVEIDSLKEIVNPFLLNKKLLIYKPNKKNITGSVFRLEYLTEELSQILTDCFDTSKLFKTWKIKYKKGFDDAKKEDIKSNAVQSYLATKCIPIQVNVTPLCDVVQGKFINYRIIAGFLTSALYYDCIKRNDYFFKSPRFSNDGMEVFIGLDLRSLSSCTKEEIEGKNYLFSIRTNLINDIQTKLASHVSRLGVFNL